MNKLIHLTAKDISEIYSKESWVPKWLSYIFWYIVLSIGYSSKGAKDEGKK